MVFDRFVLRSLHALALTSFLLLGLSACGFHLRGATEIPPELNPMYVQASGGSAVRGALLERLEWSEVRLAAAPQDAKVVLRIGRESRTSRVAAVDRDGKVLAFELHLGVAFEAVRPDGSTLVPRQEIDLVRTYENPDVEVLGKQLEREMIYEDLVQDAAERILMRLRAALL